MDKKGLSVVELIVSFVLCILVFVFIIQVVSAIEELYINLGIKTELLNKQSLISENINNKFFNNQIILIKKCGDNCLTFFYRDNTSEKMSIDKSNNTFSFGKDIYSFDGLGFVDSLTITSNNESNYGQGLLTLNLNIKNSIFDTGKYIIKAIYQYNSNETIYSASDASKVEIFLLGSATNYKFSEDLFVEPGWIVYYPDGTITINGDDVIPSELQYDSDGNGYITYKGTDAASGESVERFIKNYETAKAHIIDLYENSPSSGVYLYDGIGKYVYKGNNPDNYITIGSNLFRILSLDIQERYVLDDDGNQVEESKYMLKVVSEDYITDTDGVAAMVFGNATIGDPLYNTSAWFKKVCTNQNDPSTCTIYKQHMNTIVNDVWLAKLLNTGSGRTQIINAKFNVGMLPFDEYKLTYSYVYVQPNTTYSVSMKEIYEVEANNFVDGIGNVDPGIWNGNCVENICAPNAAIPSVTDVLFGSANKECLTEATSKNYEYFTVSCSYDNWMWPKLSTEIHYRLLTRAGYAVTWTIGGYDFLGTNEIYEKLAAKATIYLDADLYIMGRGTKENPYSLYTISK